MEANGITQLIELLKDNINAIAFAVILFGIGVMAYIYKNSEHEEHERE